MLRFACCAFLALLTGALTICAAQTGRDTTPQTPTTEAPVQGYSCVEGKPDQPRPATLKLSAGDVTRKAMHLPQPRNTPALRRLRIEGQVVVEVVIDVLDGKVIWTRTLNGLPLLREAIGDAPCRAKFFPALINSAPISVGGFITYTYKSGAFSGGGRKRDRASSRAGHRS